MDYIDEFKIGMRDIFKPAMKNMGFKVKGNYFFIPADGYKFIVHIQKSQWNTPESVSFYINVGIDIDDYSIVMNDDRKIDYNCFWAISDRIEHVLDNKKPDYIKTSKHIGHKVNEKEVIFGDVIEDVRAVYNTYYLGKELEQALLNNYPKFHNFLVFKYLISKSVINNDIASGERYLQIHEKEYLEAKKIKHDLIKIDIDKFYAESHKTLLDILNSNT